MARCSQASSRSATATASPACSAEPRSETCTLGCPPPARRCVIRIFCFLEGRTASGLCRSYVCLGAQRDGDARARARATRTRRRRGHTQHTDRHAQPYARREGHVTRQNKAARRGVRACGSARRRGRCGRRGACSSSSLQSTRHTNEAGTSICVSRREPSSSRAVEKAFCMRFCFAVCPSSPPHLRCFRANGSEVDSPR